MEDTQSTRQPVVIVDTTPTVHQQLVGAAIQIGVAIAIPLVVAGATMAVSGIAGAVKKRRAAKLAEQSTEETNLKAV